MTRIAVYSGTLVACAAAAAMTVAALLLPRWTTYTLSASGVGISSSSSPPSPACFTQALGLFQSCSTARDPACRPFPLAGTPDCPHDLVAVGPGPGDWAADDGLSFCSLWRVARLLVLGSAALELVALGVVMGVIVAGRRVAREKGWRAVVPILLAAAGSQVAGMAVVAYLFDHDERFLVPGWQLDTSWFLCLLSAAVSSLAAIGLAISAYVLPPEDGYIQLKCPGEAVKV